MQRFQPGAFESMIDSAGAEFTPAKYCVARARAHQLYLPYFLSRASFVTSENAVTFDPNGFIISVARVFRFRSRRCIRAPVETSVHPPHGKRAFLRVYAISLHPYAICKVAVTLASCERCAALQTLIMRAYNLSDLIRPSLEMKTHLRLRFVSILLIHLSSKRQTHTHTHTHICLPKYGKRKKTCAMKNSRTSVFV